MKDIKMFTRMVVAASILFEVKETGEQIIVSGARHYSPEMRPLLNLLERKKTLREIDQGFIDQWGTFMTREEAMRVVKENGQQFDLERNGGQDHILFSEGVW